MFFRLERGGQAEKHARTAHASAQCAPLKSAGVGQPGAPSGQERLWQMLPCHCRRAHAGGADWVPRRTKPSLVVSVPCAEGRSPCRMDGLCQPTYHSFALATMWDTTGLSFQRRASSPLRYSECHSR